MDRQKSRNTPVRLGENPLGVNALPFFTQGWPKIPPLKKGGRGDFCGGLVPAPPASPEAVKKLRQRENAGLGDVRGRGKFMPPKQALVSPWPKRYLIRGGRTDYLSVFIQASASCRGRFAEVRGSASKPCFTRRLFGGMNLPLPRTTK